MMKRIKLLFVILILTSTYLLAQKLDNSSVYLDYARFRYSADSIYLEIYYGISNKSLLLKDNLNEAEIKVIVKDTINNNIVGFRNFRLVNEISDNNLESDKFLTGVLGFKLYPGIFRIDFQIVDYFDSTNYYNINFLLHLKELVTKHFALSDIQLCSNIIENSENKSSYFFKNTYETHPNPSNVYGDGLPILFYYIELYDLVEEGKKNPLKMVTKIIDASGREKYNKEKLIYRKYNSIVEVGAINITKYPSGTYTLAVYLIDSLYNFGLVSSKKFFVYNSQVKQEEFQRKQETDFLSSEFVVMTEDELNIYFEKSKYIASSSEIKTWSNLDNIDSKKQFLFNFWKQRDPDPNTAENEFKKEYFDRVRKADEMFRTPRELGWKSDRGRVYIVYGEPSEIDRYPNEMDAYPYEIWSYNNIEGGVIFVFGDITGTGQMILIHSTHRGEMHDENWFRRVKKSR